VLYTFVILAVTFVGYNKNRRQYSIRKSKFHARGHNAHSLPSAAP